jgi:hypothetical protein
MPIFNNYGLGLRDRTPDRRDRALYQSVPNVDALPDHVDLSAALPPPMDQQSTSACTGFSGAVALYGVMKKDGHARPFVPSPVFLYRQARDLGGYVQEDSGAEIRNVWKGANKFGLPSITDLKPRFDPASLADNKTWIFPERSIWRREPSKSVYADAERRQAINYFNLATFPDILKCLADGWPVQFGFVMFNSFFGPQYLTADPPDPDESKDMMIGGHAVCAYGYDKPTRKLFCRNSWGATPHDGTPNFRMSFNYAQRYFSDAWTGRLIEGGKVKA